MLSFYFRAQVHWSGALGRIGMSMFSCSRATCFDLFRYVSLQQSCQLSLAPYGALFLFFKPPYRCTFRLEWHFVFGIEEHAHRDTHGYVAVSICCGQRFSRELLENFILFKAPKQKAIFACQEQQHRHPQYPDPAAASTMAKRLSIGNQKIATDH